MSKTTITTTGKGPKKPTHPVMIDGGADWPEWPQVRDVLLAEAEFWNVHRTLPEDERDAQLEAIPCDSEENRQHIALVRKLFERALAAHPAPTPRQLAMLAAVTVFYDVGSSGDQFKIGEGRDLNMDECIGNLAPIVLAHCFARLVRAMGIMLEIPWSDVHDDA